MRVETTVGLMETVRETALGKIEAVVTHGPAVIGVVVHGIIALKRMEKMVKVKFRQGFVRSIAEVERVLVGEAITHDDGLRRHRHPLGTQSLSESTRYVPNLILVSDLQMIVLLHRLENEIAIGIEGIHRVLRPEILAVPHHGLEIRVRLPIGKEVLRCEPHRCATVIADRRRPLTGKIFAAVKAWPGIDDEVEITGGGHQNSPVFIGQRKTRGNELRLKPARDEKTDRELKPNHPEKPTLHQVLANRIHEGTILSRTIGPVEFVSWDACETPAG